MPNQRQLELLRLGVGKWNEWKFGTFGLSPEPAHEEPIGDISSPETDFSGNLRGVDLRAADLSDIDLSGVDLSDVDLRAVDLSRTVLNGANFLRADLRGANLSQAQLAGADLRTDLGGANLEGADLTRADLYGAMLRGTALRMADLTRADFTEADLTLANLAGAVLIRTIFGGTNLKNALGLDQCAHVGPSIVDYSTLAKSGPLPLPFLRGCGLPDNFIDYVPSLVNQPIQFDSCFISYSTEDKEFAQRLYSDLQNKGVRCWFAPHDMQGGKKIHQQIDAAIQLHDRLLLILSETSMNSAWVRTEIFKARKRETREKRRMLFPVRLVTFETLREWECFDSDIGQDLAKEIREFYIPDFSAWKAHDSYQAAFTRLVNDLKADNSIACR